MNYLKKICLFISQSNIQKMSYYQFNRQEILHKAKETYSKEKAAEYYAKNKEAIKKRKKTDTKTCHKERDKIKEYQKKRYQQFVQ